MCTLDHAATHSLRVADRAPVQLPQPRATGQRRVPLSLCLVSVCLVRTRSQRADYSQPSVHLHGSAGTAVESHCTAAAVCLLSGVARRVPQKTKKKKLPQISAAQCSDQRHCHTFKYVCTDCAILIYPRMPLVGTRPLLSFFTVQSGRAPLFPLFFFVAFVLSLSCSSVSSACSRCDWLRVEA